VEGSEVGVGGCNLTATEYGRYTIYKLQVRMS